LVENKNFFLEREVCGGCKYNKIIVIFFFEREVYGGDKYNEIIHINIYMVENK